MNIVEIFDRYWDWLIISQKYDPFEGCFECVIKNPEKEESHKIVFRNISFFAYFHNAEARFEKDSFREMSTIIFEDEKVKFSHKTPKWLSGYKFEFNVVIEVVYSAIILKCDSLMVDDILFLIDDNNSNGNYKGK